MSDWLLNLPVLALATGLPRLWGSRRWHVARAPAISCPAGRRARAHGAHAADKPEWALVSARARSVACHIVKTRARGYRCMPH